ncbi:hypothetical protein Bbelb_186810 [Branchiostoma belcheri]|nr:hypothetical protein Bbelb_186810 [Branchiostoma belcheri]
MDGLEDNSPHLCVRPGTQQLSCVKGGPEMRRIGQTGGGDLEREVLLVFVLDKRDLPIDQWTSTFLVLQYIHIQQHPDQSPLLILSPPYPRSGISQSTVAVKAGLTAVHTDDDTAQAADIVPTPDGMTEEEFNAFVDLDADVECTGDPTSCPFINRL